MPERYFVAGASAWQVPMISLKKYLEADFVSGLADSGGEEEDMLPAAIAAYRAALVEMGEASMKACSGCGQQLRVDLCELQGELFAGMSREMLESTDQRIRERLQAWGAGAVRHYEARTREVKELLLVLARTAETAGARDERCARRMREVTERVRAIASLEDLSEIRAAIKASAMDLQMSIERMSEENRAAIAELQGQIATYQNKLEVIQETASRDSLTRLRNRLYVEGEMAKRIALHTVFSVAILDIDGFKEVNDQLGHLAGDELLKQFAAELQSMCRSTDTVGRWGGDEFIIVLDSTLAEAEERIERLKKWICGIYEIHVPTGMKSLHIRASIGLSEWAPGEKMQELLARADASMYSEKMASSAGENCLRGSGRPSSPPHNFSTFSPL